MKNISKIAMIGAVLAAGVTAASAQNTGRPSIDNPTRHWESGLMTSPGYSGGGYGYGPVEYMDHNNYGVAKDYIWATPQNDNYNNS